MKTSIVHIYLYGLLKREAKGGNLIHISKIHPIIKWSVRVPRKIQLQMIKELTELKFLKRIDRDNYEILTVRIKNPPCDSCGEPLW